MASSKLPARLVELVQEALLSSFWYKPPFRRYLLRQGVPDGLFAMWDQDNETKREFAERLFPKLEASEGWCRVIQEMGRDLAEQRTFPVLERHENSKYLQEQARTAVGHLKAFLADLDRDRDEERRRQERRTVAAQYREKVAIEKQTLEKLGSRLDELATRMGDQRAGYDFEQWFFDLMSFFDIDHRRPYKDGGRQMDGSITLDGTTYITELKFRAAAQGPNDVEGFWTKVEKRADNTMGIFVAMSGFSDKAIEGASGRKTPLILLDAQHMYLVLGGTMRFEEMIRRLRRHGSQAERRQAYLAPGKFEK